MTAADERIDDENRGDPIDILLIEPNPGDTRLFEENLRNAKFMNDFYSVTNGEEALDFLHQRGEYADAPQIDLVLLEPRLPGKNGEDVLAELDEEPSLRDVPVIMLTGSETGTEIAKSNGLDADFFVQKPMGADDFLEFVQEVEELWLAIVDASESRSDADSE
ncbi:response regulator [Halosolutus gelatinilyticus]|uniref:response regulator n=1 Tax=Halosolutus gelatinilyticus TaxID=2931975 RepID=UPI001FF3D4BE|nr:response regulator [Halosolutus gelatinilyticus]